MHHSHYSPSAQAPLLSSSDKLITSSLISCPAISVLLILDGNAQCPVLTLRGTETGTLQDYTRRYTYIYTHVYYIYNGELKPMLTIPLSALVSLDS